jgi:Family of unknown function (DUF6504)
VNTVYGEPVNVQARDDGRPARFVWRGRLYTVHAILEHWVINREWWQDPEAEPGQPELEFWRVEASPGQGMTAGVYELRRDAGTDAWTLRLGALSQSRPDVRPVPGRGQLGQRGPALPARRHPLPLVRAHRADLRARLREMVTTGRANTGPHKSTTARSEF